MYLIIASNPEETPEEDYYSFGKWVSNQKQAQVFDSLESARAEVKGFKINKKCITILFINKHNEIQYSY